MRDLPELVIPMLVSVLIAVVGALLITAATVAYDAHQCAGDYSMSKTLVSTCSGGFR